MQSELSAVEVAKRFGISSGDVAKLVGQRIIRPTRQVQGVYYFATDDIVRIQSNRNVTVSQAAAEVGVQIQRGVVTSVSKLKTWRRRALAITAITVVCLVVATGVIALFFDAFTAQTSDFFGYYYRFNAQLSQQVPDGSTTSGSGKILATSTITPPETTPVADVLKPVAVTSLVIIKVIDYNKYLQIVSKPETAATSTSTPGPQGPAGVSGTNGISGTAGPVGVTGAAGAAGAAGVDGVAGATGATGATGSDGSTTVFSITADMVLDGDVVGLQSATSVIKLKGAQLGDTTPTAGNLLIGDGATWTSQATSGDVTLSSSGSLSLADIITPGSYGAADVIPVISIDSKGRVTGVINTTISGLTVAHFSSGTISQWANDSDYVTPTSINTLTNKTLTAPQLNGTVTTAGLTMPGFAAGNITGNSSVGISGFGTINGLVLAPLNDGFTVSGGVSSRMLTLTGADITLGSTIRPTSASPLTVQSTGANSLTLDTGGAAGLFIGTANASGTTIGKTGATTAIQGKAEVGSLSVGSGSTITKHLSATASVDAPAIASGCVNVANITVAGAAAGDTAIATPTPVAGGIETMNLTWSAYASSANTVSIRSCWVSGTPNPSPQTWRIDVWQH